MEPPPPPSREEAPTEKRPLDAADDPAEVAAKKQRLADPSSPIDPKDVEGLKDEHRQEAIAQREAAAKAKIQAEAEEREQKRAAEASRATPEDALHAVDEKVTKVAKDGWSLSGSSSELSSLSSLSTAKPRAGRPSFFT